MPAPLKQSFHFRLHLLFCATMVGSLLCIPANSLAAAQEGCFPQKNREPSSREHAADDPTKSPPNLQTSQEWNRHLKELLDSYSAVFPAGPLDYRIGFDDVLDISVFEAQELNREVRVSSAG